MTRRFAIGLAALLGACATAPHAVPAPTFYAAPDSSLRNLPFSEAVQVGDLLFLSGQIPLDPSTGNLVPGDVTVQTQCVVDNLAAILAAAGASFANVVKTTVYLLDMNDFAAMNAVYGAAMPTPPPARSTVQVSRLPRDVRVEIDVVAYLGDQ